MRGRRCNRWHVMRWYRFNGHGAGRSAALSPSASCVLVKQLGGDRMGRIFREILVTAELKPDAHELLDCMDELRAIHEQFGDNHGYAVFAQVWGCENVTTQFYLTGKILTPDQAHRIKAILAE